MFRLRVKTKEMAEELKDALDEAAAGAVGGDN
jgi:hypothetical protein